MINAYFRPGLTLFGLLTLLLGVVYPLVVTGIAQVIFPYRANGSVVERNGKEVGSELIGQAFDDPKEGRRMLYFWGRPSATDPVPYTSFNGDTSTGSNASNLGPTNESYIAESVTIDGEEKPGIVQARVNAIREAHLDQHGPVPVDLVTASGSGLDPHISPAAAEYQIARVAKARGWSEKRVRELVQASTQHRMLGFLGEPRVNVLLLNLSLDKAD
jgi:potassium-transporting ATPase KdpC subunit